MTPQSHVIRAIQRLLMALFVLGVLLPSHALATSDHDATAHVHFLVQQRTERGLVLGPKRLAVGPEVVLSSGALDGQLATLAVAYGINDKLEIFANPRWQSFAPSFYDPAIGARYRFRDGLFEMAAQGSLRLAAFADPKTVAFDARVPMRMHFRENLSLDAVPSLSILVSPNADWYLSMPLWGNFNLTDAIALTGGTEVSLQEGAAGASGMTIGGSWTGAKDGKPWLEIGARARWATVANEGVVQLTLFATYYGHLASR